MFDVNEVSILLVAYRFYWVLHASESMFRLVLLLADIFLCLSFDDKEKCIQETIKFIRSLCIIVFF